MKVLVAVDGSKHSIRAVREAFALLARMPLEKHTLHLLAVHDPRSVQLATRAIAKSELDRFLAEQSAESLREAEKFATRAVDASAESGDGNAGIAWRSLSRQGPIASTIAREAERGNYDLVVLGTKGRGGFKDLLMGSVAQRLPGLTQKPVLLVP